jgi:type VI secretion system protein ImpE
MEAINLFRQSRLDDAYQSLTEALRRSPADVDQRYAMAGLLAFRGEFDRALSHLDFIAGEQPQLATAVASYASSIEAEEERRRVYADGHVPTTEPNCEAMVRQRVLLRQCLRQGDAGGAERALAAIAAEPPVAATVDGTACTALRDLDDGFGALLEVFTGGRCLWLPFATLRSVELSPPRGLLDLLWAQAELETVTGRRFRAHVPVLYHGTAARTDPQVRCGHKTEWVDELGVAFRGFGQRMFAAGERELDLLSMRSIRFAAAAAR